MTSSVEAGLARLRSLSCSLPEQLLGGYAQGVRLSPRRAASLDRIVVVGMGGSAIAGDLVRGLMDAETEAALEVVRSPVLPRSVRRGNLVVAASYSGSTWETLAGYDEAGRRGVDRVAVASGGPLAEKAVRDGVPLVSVPPGGPPRAWVGFTLGALLGVLEPAFDRPNGTRVRSAAVRATRIALRESGPTGRAARWAQTIGRLDIAIYADAGFGGLARRWKTSVEENAKRPAEFDLLPEMFHNALVAWDRRAPPDRRGVALLSWANEDPAVTSRIQYLQEVLARRHVPLFRAMLEEKDRLAATMEGILLGDFFTLALAEGAQVDPYPIDAIVKMKAALEPAARGSTRPSPRSR